jgi:pimeloyl-ACP methyl ester carboxylesterase
MESLLARKHDPAFCFVLCHVVSETSYALYLSDIGASIGFRLAVMHPERVTTMIVQNGEAHFEAFDLEFSKGII